nr:venom protein [Lampona murina]
MWTLSLLILGFVGSSLSERCNLSKCREGDVFRGFPENGEDLLQLCRNIETLGECVLEERENCEDHGRGATNDEIRQAVTYLRSACQEETTTFKVISNNLRCMAPVIETMEETGCTDFLSEEGVEILKANLLPVFDEWDDRAKCLWSVIDVKCRALTLGHHCGEDVVEPVEEVLVNMGTDEISACTPEILEELEILIELLEATLLEELALQEEIEERK